MVVCLATKVACTISTFLPACRACGDIRSTFPLSDQRSLDGWISSLAGFESLAREYGFQTKGLKQQGSEYAYSRQGTSWLVKETASL